MGPSETRQKRPRRNESLQARLLILCARFFLAKPQTEFAVWDFLGCICDNLSVSAAPSEKPSPTAASARPATTATSVFTKWPARSKSGNSNKRKKLPFQGSCQPKADREVVADLHRKTQTANLVCGLERKKRAQRKRDVACGGSFRRGHF